MLTESLIVLGLVRTGMATATPGGLLRDVEHAFDHPDRFYLSYLEACQLAVLMVHEGDGVDSAIRRGRFLYASVSAFGTEPDFEKRLLAFCSFHWSHR